MPDRPRRRWGFGRILLAALALGAVVAVGRGAAVVYVDYLWFRSVGVLDPWLTRLSWEWGVRAFVAGITALVVLANLRLVVGNLGGIQIRRRFGDLEIAEQVPRSVLLGSAAILSILVGLWFAASVPAEAGTGALLFLHGPRWGMADPVLGRDLGFYLFRLPVLASALTFTLVLVFFLLAVVTAAYAGTGSIRWARGGLRAEPVPRLHLAVLASIFLLALAVRFQVVRYALLMEGSSAVRGIFGYTDAEARLPALTALSFMALAAAAATLWSGLRGRALPALVAAAGLVVGGIAAGQVYPAVVQRVQVEPNELARETPHIQHNLAFTRLGFGLAELERRTFPYRPPGREDWPLAAAQFQGIPVWTTPTLQTTFRQVDSRFRYYDFPEVSITRYVTPSGPVPVALAVREVNPDSIPSGSGEGDGGRRASWQNVHLRERYVTGLGAVAAMANRATPEGRPPAVLSGIPPEFTPGRGVPDELALRWSSVFFGLRTDRYAVLNPGPDAFLAPDGSPGVPGVDFPEGIPMGGILRSFAIAWRFQDWNLLLASEVRRDSRFVHRRQVVERARAIAPFLRYAGTPYPVVVEERIHWILDGFTASPWFPLATAHPLEPRRPVRYLRGNVKVTVDAVTGETRFYTMGLDDPLLDGWRRAFPGLIRPLEEMPEGLRQHLRYPRELLTAQADVLLRYHQETAPLFHSEQELWARATQLGQGSGPVAYLPEYGVWTLPGETEPEFLLSTVFVPSGRENLAAFLVARSDADRYGRLVLYDVPVEDRFPGPRQVGALVEQDPVIAQQFSLWRQGGSQVWTGHLHLIPAGNTLLYMEPVFLAARTDAIPELRRFIVSDGRRVVMAETLARGLSALSEGGSGALPGGEESGPGTAPDRAWSAEALALLDRADERLRAGDLAGFGRALEALRAFLEQAAVP